MPVRSNVQKNVNNKLANQRCADSVTKYASCFSENMLSHVHYKNKNFSPGTSAGKMKLTQASIS